MLKHGGFGHRPLSFGEFVFLFVSSLLVFWSLRGCSRVWLLLDLKVTLPCCLCVLSIPSLSLLQPLAKCPSIVSWEISLLTAVLPLLVGGTTAPRYYRSWHGTTAASREVKTEGVRGGSPHTPFSFFLPLSRSKGAIRGTLSGVPSPCRPSVLFSGGINPHPPRVPWTPVLPHSLSLSCVHLH